MKKFSWVIFFVFFSFKMDHSNLFYCGPGEFHMESPVRNRISMTGSFGELRNNHFHAGTDIRSLTGVGGDDLLAVAQGFVSRIVIDADNYGKSLFVQHPQGYTTMYAHINRFRSDIEARIKTEQYKHKSFELDLTFQPNEIIVNSGDLLAYMGNTGSSRGAHLHFELRRTGTDEVLDPVAFGLPVEDDISPSIKRIKVYGFDGEGITTSEKIYSPSQLSKTILVPGDVMALGINALDQSDHSWNWVGIKTIKVLVDSQMIYFLSLDHWSLEDTKYINAHIDYKNKMASKGQFHRCFKLLGNKLSLYKTIENNGLYYIGDSLLHRVQLIVGDAKQNESKVEFNIQKVNYTTPVKKNENSQKLVFDQEHILESESVKFDIPQGCFYENLCCTLDSCKNSLPIAYSDWFGIKPNNDPIHKPYKIAIKPSKSIPERLMSKCYIACKQGSRYISTGGNWEGEYLVSEFKKLGTFSIQVDTIPPTIIPYTFRSNMPKNKFMSFGLYDNIISLGTAREIQYNAYIDGQWILMEHDAKTRSIKHYFEDDLSSGKHELLITAIDDRGNKREFNSTFYR